MRGQEWLSWHSNWSGRRKKKTKQFWLFHLLLIVKGLKNRVCGLKVSRKICMLYDSWKFSLGIFNVISRLLANENLSTQKLRRRFSYLLFGAFLQGDPVLPIRADVHLVGLDEVDPPGLLGNGALGAYGRDEPQEPKVHLWGAKRERGGGEWGKIRFKWFRIRKFHRSCKNDKTFSLISK